MDRKFLSLFTDLVHSIKHSTEFLIEVLSYEPIVRKEATELIRAEIWKIYWYAVAWKGIALRLQKERSEKRLA
jgi:hypothetical protein